MQKTSALAVLILALLPLTVLASPITRIIRVTDTNGNPVSGATLTAGGTALVAGTATTVSGKALATGAALSAPVNYVDYNDGTGEYGIIEDPATGEVHFAITASKSGVTLSNPTFGLDFYADASVILSTNANTVTLGNGQASLASGQNDLKTGQATILNSTSSAARQGDINTVLDARGLTTVRVLKLENADVPTSTRQPSGPVVATVPAAPPWYVAPVAYPTDYAKAGVAPTWYTAPTAPDLSALATTAQLGPLAKTADLAGLAHTTDLPSVAAFVTALKADTQWQKLFAYSAGKYSVSGNVVTFYAADDATPVLVLTLTKDTAGNVTGRTHN